MRRHPAPMANSPVAAAVAMVLLAGCGEPSGEQSRTGAPPIVRTASGVTMVSLPAGWFEMGSAGDGEVDQKPHRVFVSAFSIDENLVTQESYEALMGKNPSHWPGPKNPVEQIRWAEAAAYCNARSRAEGLAPAYDLATGQCNFESGGYRLPTEAEYEYALRAGSTTAYFFGNSPDGLARHAWFKGNSPRGTHPVGQKPPNRWGLRDMIGNVWQWCNDYYEEGYYDVSPERDPRGPATGKDRVVRGGSWNSKPGDCRSAYRYCEVPAFTDICFAKDIHGQIGFRCARSRAE